VGYGATLHMGTTPVQLNLSVQNLLDTAYRDYLSRFRYFIDEPGRSVVLRLQVPIGSFEP
jgi:iron complex outermembrane receptor protein